MKYLLNLKKDSCPAFQKKLEDTKDKKIVHTVASRYWGTGGGANGTGQNVFGKLLI
jgi:predicted NAD-dependent protein-ADP-ribosyltransferase YbiA (DUF1768 family)